MGSKTVSAEVFLKCIIDAPTDEIKAIMSNKKSDKNNKSDISDESFSNAVEDFKKRFVADVETEESKEKSADNETFNGNDNALNTREQISLMTQKVKNMQKKLSSAVFGQDNAINIFVSGYFQAELRRISAW